MDEKTRTFIQRQAHDIRQGLERCTLYDEVMNMNDPDMVLVAAFLRGYAIGQELAIHDHETIINGDPINIRVTYLLDSEA